MLQTQELGIKLNKKHSNKAGEYMDIYKAIAFTLILSTSYTQADELSNFKNDLEISASKMMADANQHARCFILASVSRETLIAKLHYAHGTYVLEQEYFDKTADVEMNNLLDLKLSKKELESYAYNRYNGNCKHLHLGRPKV